MARVRSRVRVGDPSSAREDVELCRDIPLTGIPGVEAVGSSSSSYSSSSTMLHCRTLNPWRWLDIPAWFPFFVSWGDNNDSTTEEDVVATSALKPGESLPCCGRFTLRARRAVSCRCARSLRSANRKYVAVTWLYSFLKKIYFCFLVQHFIFYIRMKHSIKKQNQFKKIRIPYKNKHFLCGSQYLSRQKSFISLLRKYFRWKSNVNKNLKLLPKSNQ